MATSMTSIEVDAVIAPSPFSKAYGVGASALPFRYLPEGTTSISFVTGKLLRICNAMLKSTQLCVAESQLIVGM